MLYKQILKDYKILESKVKQKLSRMDYKEIMNLGFNKIHAFKLKSGEKPTGGPGGFKSIIELAKKLKI